MLRAKAASPADTALSGGARSVLRFSMPTFWDGFADAFSAVPAAAVYNELEDRSADLYVGILRDWAWYAAEANRVLEQHAESR